VIQTHFSSSGSLFHNMEWLLYSALTQNDLFHPILETRMQSKDAASSGPHCSLWLQTISSFCSLSLVWCSNRQYFENLCPRRIFFISSVYLNWKGCFWNRILYLSQENTPKKEQVRIHLQALLLQFQYKRQCPIKKLTVFYLSKYSRLFLG